MINGFEIELNLLAKITEQITMNKYYDWIETALIMANDKFHMCCGMIHVFANVNVLLEL